MGLDMYLTKCKKADIEALRVAENKFYHGGEYTRVKEIIANGDYSIGDVVCSYEGFDIYVEGIETYKYPSFSKKVGYWRKANHIHRWFVKNVQDWEDDCQTYVVSPESLKALKDLCKEVLEDKDLADELLPTASGFFFGSTDYEGYYFDDTKDTIKIINKVLLETDFETEMILYHSSW